MKFSDVIGHDEAKKLLREMVRNKRLPHALLLWGAPGIGKLALARAFAQYVHCAHSAGSHDSCGQCPACLQHESLSFPDMMYAYPTAGSKGGRAMLSDDYLPQWRQFLTDYPLAPYEKWLELMNADNSQPTIRTDESMEIIRKFSLSNYASSMKVMILWLPEKLQPAAAYKLLKLIEEPEEGNMFVMVSNAPQLILPTVFSRLQRIRLESPRREELEGWLMSRHDLDPARAAEVARVAEGNPARALSLLEELGEEAQFRSLFQEVMRKSWLRDVSGLKAWSEEVAQLRREKSRRFLGYCLRQLRQNFVYNLHLPSLVPQTNADRQFSSRFAPFIHPGNVEALMKEFSEADLDIAANANARIVFFDLALRLIMLIKIPAPQLKNTAGTPK